MTTDDSQTITCASQELFSRGNKCLVRAIVKENTDFFNLTRPSVKLLGTLRLSRLGTTLIGSLALGRSSPGRRCSRRRRSSRRSNIIHLSGFGKQQPHAVDRSRHCRIFFIRHFIFAQNGGIFCRPFSRQKHITLTKEQPTHVYLREHAMDGLHVIIRRICTSGEDTRERSRRNTELVREILLRKLRIIHHNFNPVFHKFIILYFIFLSFQFIFFVRTPHKSAPNSHHEAPISQSISKPYRPSGSRTRENYPQLQFTPIHI